MSSLDLIDYSIREMGRVLLAGGRAVFNVPTTGWPGHLIDWARRSWTNLKGHQNKQKLRALEERLIQGPHGSAVFTEQEIMQDMFQLECRRMKSLPLARLRAATRSSGLEIYRMRRGEFGLTLVAVEKQ
jgi:hypothetical protein